MQNKLCIISSIFFLVAIIINPALYSQIPDTPDNLKNNHIFSATDISSMSFIPPSKPGPEHIFVVYNTNSSYGDSIATYYKEARQIPLQNICPITCDTSEVITRDYFNSNIRDVLRDSLNIRGIKEQIRFLVLTKGMPLKISGSAELEWSSVDSELCLLFNDEYSTDYRKDNPYFGEIHYFDSFTYPIYSSSQISYLVSRLDAFSLTQVLQLKKYSSIKTYT